MHESVDGEGAWVTLLYCTADRIGEASGGGLVTLHESRALLSLGPCEVWDRDRLQGGSDPWGWDDVSAEAVRHWHVPGVAGGTIPGLAHFYSGTFGKTVAALKRNGCKVAYTIAAHDRAASRAEHERFGIDFAGLYPHLVQDDLWERYIEGYRLADVIVCPSTVAADTVRGYGPDFEGKRIEVIPHGCDLPKRITPLPKRFTVGYLGSYGLDKGVVYLLQAWKKLAYRDAVLVLAGRDSLAAGRQLYDQFGGGSVIFQGWVGDVGDFYNQISLYVQPSVTEGFGIEVLESLAHGRPALCSRVAGAQDVVFEEWKFQPRDVDELAGHVDDVKQVIDLEGPHWQQNCRAKAEKFTWDKVEDRYAALWRELLGEGP